MFKLHDVPAGRIDKPEELPILPPDPAMVAFFAHLIDSGDELRPILLYPKGERYVLIDGINSLEAHRLNGLHTLALLDITPKYWKPMATRLRLQTRRLRRVDIKETVIEAWTGGIDDISEIARLLGVTRRYVQAILKPLRDIQRRHRDEEILRLYSDGLTQQEIAKRVGITQQAVGKALERMQATEDAIEPNDTLSSSSKVDITEHPGVLGDQDLRTNRTRKRLPIDVASNVHIYETFRERALASINTKGVKR